MKHDLIIVGGGFAGLSCAGAAACRGLRTLVLDAKQAAGARVHTTGILVKEVADLWDVPRRLTRKVPGVRLYTPNLNSIDLVSPGYYFLATDTGGLLRWWADQARDSGATVRFGQPYEGADIALGRVTLRGCDASARYLIGADGARSAVAADLGLGRNRAFLTGVEAAYEGVRGIDEDRLHVFLDSNLAPGYIAWVVPGCGVTQVGLAVRRPHVPRLDALVQRLSSLFDFSRAVRVEQRAGLIPVGGPVRPMSMDGAMLIGDAAGMVSPLTAGGIHTAIHYGRLAGLAVCDHLLDGGPEPARVVRQQAPTFIAKRLMRAAFDLRPANWMYDLALASRPMRALAQLIFYHHRGLLSPAAWRDAVSALAGR